jgi:hypothetical protein
MFYIMPSDLFLLKENNLINTQSSGNMAYNAGRFDQWQLLLSGIILTISWSAVVTIAVIVRSGNA